MCSLKWGISSKMSNKTINGFGFRMMTRINKASICVIRLSLPLRRITQTLALIILVIMLNLNLNECLAGQKAFL